MLTPKVFYTVSELAATIGMNRRTCDRLLVRMGIPMKPGKPRLVWLSDIQAVAPEMYASMAESDRLKTRAERLRLAGAA